MELEGIIGRTSVVRRNLNPVWDETFVYYALVRRHIAHFQVFDWDGDGTHDFLGGCKVSLQGLPLGRTEDRRLALVGRLNGKPVKGTLELRLLLEANYDCGVSQKGDAKGLYVLVPNPQGTPLLPVPAPVLAPAPQQRPLDDFDSAGLRQHVRSLAALGVKDLSWLLGSAHDVGNYVAKKLDKIFVDAAAFYDGAPRIIIAAPTETPRGGDDGGGGGGGGGKVSGLRMSTN